MLSRNIELRLKGYLDIMYNEIDYVRRYNEDGGDEAKDRVRLYDLIVKFVNYRGEIWRSSNSEIYPMGVVQLFEFNDRGISYCDMYIDRYGGQYSIYRYRGDLKTYNKDYEGAIEDYNKSFEMGLEFGGCNEGIINVAEIYCNMGRFREAYECMIRTIDIGYPIGDVDADIGCYYDSGVRYYRLWRDICIGIDDRYCKDFCKGMIDKSLDYLDVSVHGELMKYREVCDKLGDIKMLFTNFDIEN